jgi:hypothetical protein
MANDVNWGEIASKMIFTHESDRDLKHLIRGSRPPTAYDLSSW